MVNQKKHPGHSYSASIMPVVILALLGIGCMLGSLSLLHTSHKPLDTTILYPLWEDARVSQSFEATYPGLSRIDLAISKQGQNGGEIIFHLKRNCADEANLRRVVVDLAEIGEGQPTSFPFSPVYDSAGEAFCLMLEAGTSLEPDQIRVYASGTDTYLAGRAYYEANTSTENSETKIPEESDQIYRRTLSPTYFIWLPFVAKSDPYDLAESDIVFELHYDGARLNTLNTLLTQLSAHKPYLFGQSWFYIFIFIVYGFSLVLFWIVVRNFGTDLE